MSVKAGPVLLLAAAAVCLGLALADQLSSGDVYERGSSLRTDQEGASAYFEALTRTGKDVVRNYTPVEFLHSTGAAIVMLRVSPSQLNERLTTQLTGLAKAGNRVVIALDGRVASSQTLKNWDLAIAPAQRFADQDEDGGAEWPVYFQPGTEWHVVRSEKNRPVAVERAFGSGSIALIGATWPFLNLALRDRRDTPLLAWAAAGQKRIVFDESSLGSRQTGTILGLMRRLRLQGLIAALLTASLLFFWRASVPFPPVSEAEDPKRPQLLGGATSGEALRNLLERRIPVSELIAACVDEWSRDFGRRSGSEAVSKVSEAAAANVPATERWARIREVVRESRRA